MISPIASNELASQRMKLCNQCPQLRYAWGVKLPFVNKLKTCGVCKCSLAAKTKLTYATCPLYKW